MLDKIPKLTTLATGLTIVFSVLYDWAYFRIVEPNFFNHLTLGEHISSALEHIPVMGIFWGLTVIYLIGRKPTPIPEDEMEHYTDENHPLRPIIFSRTEDRITGVKVDSIFTITTMWVMAIVVEILNIRFIHMFWLIAIIITWPRLVRSVCEECEKSGREFLKPYLVIIPVFVAYALLSGWNAGTYDLRAGATHDLKSSSSQLNYKVHPLRKFENGLLVRVPSTQKNYFISWDKVQFLERFSPVNEDSPLCRWVNWCWLDLLKKKNT